MCYNGYGAEEDKYVREQRGTEFGVYRRCDSYGDTYMCGEHREWCNVGDSGEHCAVGVAMLWAWILVLQV